MDGNLPPTFLRGVDGCPKGLDALAALWTAQRIHSGTAVRLPAVEERDECGFPMQMLA